jgi:hypothetical protein
LTLRTPLGENQVWNGRPSSDYQDLDHPLSFAVIDQTTYNWGTEARYIVSRAAVSPRQTVTIGLQYFSTRRTTHSSRTSAAIAGA